VGVLGEDDSGREGIRSVTLVDVDIIYGVRIPNLPREIYNMIRR